MFEFLSILASPWNLLLLLLVFGFAPGFALRVIVKLYPRSDGRRKELVAELYAMRRIERPLWVAEQLETALFEGPHERLRSRRARKGEQKSLTVTFTRAEFLHDMYVIELTEDAVRVKNHFGQTEIIPRDVFPNVALGDQVSLFGTRLKGQKWQAIVQSTPNKPQGRHRKGS